MEKHEIRFKFEGDLVGGNLIDASDGSSFHDGARQLLALYSYFYVHGAVPRRAALANTSQYRVFESPAREGCIEFGYAVGLFVGGVITGLGSGFGKKAAEIVFDEFLSEGLKNVLRAKRSPPPFAIARHPSLSVRSGNHEPMLDYEIDDNRRWDELRQRSIPVAIGAARPVGRCAKRLTIFPGNSRPIVFDVDALDYLTLARARYLEGHIQVAVNRIKDQRAQPYPS